MNTSDSAPQRLLLIGLDGATFDILRPLMQMGCLPRLARLMEEGSHGPLLSTIPPLTAPAWSTFHTGVNPGKHGVFDFFQTTAEGSQRGGVVNSGSVRCLPFWHYLGQAGKRVGLVNVPMTYPPQPIHGFVVSGMPAPLRPRNFTYPPELAERLPDYKIDLPYFLGGREFQAEYVPAANRLLKDLGTLMQLRGEHTLRLMREEPWDVLMVVFTETDRVGHFLWASLEKLVQGEVEKQLELTLVAWFMALDDLIGRLVAEAGAAALTLVISDHGMGPSATRRFYVNDWLLQEGFLSLRRHAWTNPNTWLRGLGISRDAAARLLSLLPRRLVGALRSKVGRIDVPVDNSRSRAYLQPIYEFVAGIRLVDGSLSDKSEGLLRELTESLLSVIAPETGDRVVDKVYRREEAYHGPYVSESPHLIAILNPDFVANHRVGNKALVGGRREISGAAMVAGAHRFEGILIAHGPGIKKQSRPHFGFRLQDISPSVLHLMRLPVPDHMDGRVLQEVIEADLLEQRPVQYVSTDLPGPVGGGPGLTAREEAEVRRQLKGLGYLS